MIIALATLSLSVLMGCNDNRYEKLVEQELARNVRYDSLFLGFRFGMTNKEFYTSCWEMNKQGLIRQGPSNLSVQYDLDSSYFQSAAQMNFYPKFHEKKIYTMPMEFNYTVYAPWNEELTADNLLIEVKSLLEKWYDGKFELIENYDGTKKVWIKVDGNRRIRLFKKDVRLVKAEITDLTMLPIVQEKDKSTEEK
ncbi:MAG: hypothetical protein AAFN93_23445 [Bacteroidota bacterium]